MTAQTSTASLPSAMVAQDLAPGRAVPQIAIVIATKGRPAAVTEVVRLLERQTLTPSRVVISATGSADIEASLQSSVFPLELIYGSAGSSKQRNRALERVRQQADIVVFFDDDFAPAITWLEHCAFAFASDAHVIGIGGRVLRDGATDAGVSWEEAKRLISDPPPLPPGPPTFLRTRSLYGCNMAFRITAIGDLRFDERLVLYGWMEDKDFSRIAGRAGRLVRYDGMVGVHLGIKSGKVSGKKYGYSQVVNAWYLYRKKVLSRKEAWRNLFRAILANGIKSFRPEKDVDRYGRFVGNLVGVGELIRGRCRPERAEEL
jgi:glycosyltransferase involved in cell wall biosynthesis